MPYLAHLDFTKSVRELVDQCDYMVLNLTDDYKSSGISQYYKSEAALDKLLSNVIKSRNEELGKLAAYEY